MTELWWRNPSNYVKELLHCNESNIIFDYGWIVRRKITNVQEWAELYYGAAGASGSKYRLLICGTQGTVEFKPGRVDPVAVYPTWQYGEDEAVLESYMANNVGNDKELCDDDETDILERPVLGQEHRVIVMNFPALNLGPGKLFIKFIKDLQDEYPDAILHLHGVSVFAMPCRVGFKSFDWEPRNRAAMGEIELPTGKRVNATKSPLQPHKEWIRLFGFLPIDLMEPRNRCIFNIKSARWAAEHFRKDVKISFRPKSTDATTPDANYSPEESMNVFTKGRGKIIPLPGDKFVCNSCSLAVTCKFYREGSVCTVPSSEPKELASFFRSRDTTSIIDGVAAVLQINSNRLEKGLEMEEIMGLDPEVTRIASVISKDAAMLAKLIDPSLRSPKVQVTVGAGGNAQIGIADPKAIIASVVRELEQQGYARSEITSEMIEGVLTRGGAQPRAIEGNVVDSRTAPVAPVQEMPF